MISERLMQTLKRHEGYRKHPYKCTEGHLTIGIGRTLDIKGISQEEAEYLMINDIREVQEGLIKSLPYFDKLPVAAQEVLINMGFQMGVDGVLKFRKTLVLMEEGRWGDAAKEMLNSRWAAQTPGRARELSSVIMNLIYPVYSKKG